MNFEGLFGFCTCIPFEWYPLLLSNEGSLGVKSLCGFTNSHPWIWKKDNTKKLPFSSALGII